MKTESNRPRATVDTSTDRSRLRVRAAALGIAIVVTGCASVALAFGDFGSNALAVVCGAAFTHFCHLLGGTFQRLRRF